MEFISEGIFGKYSKRAYRVFYLTIFIRIEGRGIDINNWHLPIKQNYVRFLVTFYLKDIKRP